MYLWLDKSTDNISLRAAFGGEIQTYARCLVGLLLETSNNWCVNVDKGLLNGVIFIDSKKAFDTIDHQIILQKLAKYGVDQVALKWFYLPNRL